MSKSINIVDKDNLPQKIIPKNKNFLDITNQKFGRLVALYPCGYLEKDQRLAWLCKCDCGNYIQVTGKRLRTNGTKSCGCLQRDISVQNNKKRGREIKVGDKFGKLMVVKDLGLLKRESGKYANKYMCNCDCGTKNIEIWGVYLNTGETKSCGCLHSNGEQIISNFLSENNIRYQSQYIFKDLVSKTNTPLRFDFMLLNSNGEKVLIEYQGDIHFSYRENGWNNKKHFDELLIRDKLKRDYCKDNNYSLYEITYLDNVIEKLKDILNKEGITIE